MTTGILCWSELLLPDECLTAGILCWSDLLLPGEQFDSRCSVSVTGHSRVFCVGHIPCCQARVLMTAGILCWSELLLPGEQF